MILIEILDYFSSFDSKIIRKKIHSNFNLDRFDAPSMMMRKKMKIILLIAGLLVLDSVKAWTISSSPEIPSQNVEILAQCPDETDSCFVLREQTDKDFQNQICFAKIVAEAKFNLKDKCLSLSGIDLKVSDDNETKLKRLDSVPMKVSLKNECPQNRIDVDATYCLLLNPSNLKREQNLLTLDNTTILARGFCENLHKCSPLRTKFEMTELEEQMTKIAGVKTEPNELSFEKTIKTEDDLKETQKVSANEERSVESLDTYESSLDSSNPSRRSLVPPISAQVIYSPSNPAPSYAPLITPAPPKMIPGKLVTLTTAPPPAPAPAAVAYAPSPAPAPAPAAVAYAPAPAPAPAPAAVAYAPAPAPAPAPAAVAYVPPPAPAPAPAAVAYAPPPAPAPAPAAVAYVPPPAPAPAPAAVAYAPPAPAPAPAAVAYVPPPAPAPAPAAVAYAPPPPAPAPAPAAVAYAPPPPAPAPAPAAVAYAPPPPAPAPAPAAVAYVPPPAPAPAPAAVAYAPPAPAPAPAAVAFAPPPSPAPAPAPSAVAYAPAPAPAPAPVIYFLSRPPAPLPASLPMPYPPPLPSTVMYGPSSAPTEGPQLTYSKKVESYNLTAPIMTGLPMPVSMPAVPSYGPSYKRSLVRSFPLFRNSDSNLFEDYYASSHNISDVCPTKPSSCPICIENFDEESEALLNVCDFANIIEAKFSQFEDMFKFNISKSMKSDQNIDFETESFTDRSFDFVFNEKCLEQCPQLESAYLLLLAKEPLPTDDCFIFDNQLVLAPSTYLNKFDIRRLLKKHKCKKNLE
ncbi:Filamentous hemagglutinin [Sarcoptes scabiei]|nr:Filamentous hemagglutinin [Sarcoptes scabiei]